MSDPDHVLAAIDNAINDSFSPDAMRWTPEPPDEPQLRIPVAPRVQVRLNFDGVEEAFRRAGDALQTVISGFNAAGSLNRGDFQLEPGEVSGDSYARYDDGTEIPEWERELIDRQYREWCAAETPEF